MNVTCGRLAVISLRIQNIRQLVTAVATRIRRANPCQEKQCRNGGECIFQNNQQDQDYQCKCKPGFSGEQCEEDINECSSGAHKCHAKADCTNTDGYYTCKCKPGYQGDGRTCTDINECSSGAHKCHAKADCTNTDGSYTCKCKPGYYGDGYTSCTDDVDDAVECRQYIRLSEGNRRDSHVKSGAGTSDDKLSPGWHRFVGAAGSRMADTCVPKYRCDTNAPGWLSGGQPNVQDGMVSRKVCFNWSGNCCHSYKTIMVRNCGSFYVYKLITLLNTSIRYCSTG
ncbi:hypothetical protein QZH41_012446 [Actinostola sp. cb2023]|nr:hypothetical protein QZH41_012446 [Actinostola sp. cb2023]